MLFNSFIFIFGFLPLALALTYALGHWSQRGAKLAVTLLSLGFYAWWRPVHLILLVGSILFNYAMGVVILRARAANRQPVVAAALTFGVLADIALLGWFKYANFVVDNVNALTGAGFTLGHIILPLAISFFTFQKIAYLIDAARGETEPIGLLDFATFTAFFPQLIAGPIVHYREFVPQIQTRLFGRLNWRNVMVGLTIFSIGLFKKTVIADTLAAYANPLFTPRAAGAHYDLQSGWLAAITFSFQLYFDFSGYSDMAIGLGRMLGVKLPLNFHSPLRAASIIDYWRRWHMTLQRFIVAYIFQPLSLPLNRLAAQWGLRRWSAFAVGMAIPTVVTFVAVGIWHGAGWTFILFGVMHGVYICVNEAWREARRLRARTMRRAGKTLAEPGPLQIAAYHGITLLAVVYANVMFRAVSVKDALMVWTGMSGLGASLHQPPPDLGVLSAIALGVVVVFAMPNTQQIMGRFEPAQNWREWRDVALAPIRWTWKPSFPGLAFAAATLFLGVMFIQRGQAVFLYFKF
jgi:D-alanyl-lipoteichoic acid acyltransferase DltB (MBOAT superfamily)